MQLFRRRAFSASLMTNTLGFFAAFGAFFFVAQYLQVVEGLSPLEAGLWSLPSSAGFVVGAMLGPVLLKALRPGHLMAGGLAVAAAGFALLTQTDGLGILVAGSVIFALGLAPVAAVGTDLDRRQRTAGAGRRRLRDVGDQRRARRRAGHRRPRQRRRRDLPHAGGGGAPRRGSGGRARHGGRSRRRGGAAGGRAGRPGARGCARRVHRGAPGDRARQCRAAGRRRGARRGAAARRARPARRRARPDLCPIARRGSGPDAVY